MGKKPPEPDEQWKDIPGCPGFEASTWGQIRRMTDGRILKGGRGKGWVRQVMLPGCGLRCLHILVAQTFLGPWPEPHEAIGVQFRDGDRQNCRPENLCYGPKERGMRGATRTTKGAPQKVLLVETVLANIWKKLTPCATALAQTLAALEKGERDAIR